MRVHLLAMIGSVGAPALSSRLMELVGPAPVLWLGPVLVIFAALLIQFVPETKPAARIGGFDGSRPTNSDAQPPPPKPILLRQRIRRSVSGILESLVMLKSRSLVLILTAALATQAVTMATMQFMAQYASKRYDISLAQSGNLLSMYGLANLLVILFILPAVSHFIRADATPLPIRQADDRQRDMLMARSSIFFFVLGSALMAVSPSVWYFIAGLMVLSLGTGYGSLIRSLAAVYVDAEHTTRLYSVYMIVETVGGVYSNPMLAGLFTLGMRLGGILVGLPYAGVGGVCLLGFILMLFVRLPQRLPGEDQESQSDDV
jgi:MFS family permease